MSTTEELQTRLAMFRTARDKLILGNKRTSVSYDGETVEYSAANRPQIEAEISKIEVQLGLRTSGRARSRRVTS